RSGSSGRGGHAPGLRPRRPRQRARAAGDLRDELREGDGRRGQDGEGRRRTLTCACFREAKVEFAGGATVGFAAAAWPDVARATGAGEEATESVATVVSRTIER